MRRRRAALPVLLLAVALGAAACGGGAKESSGSGDLGAAEPSRAPTPTETPAGTVTEVAPLPQGIVYDAKTDRLAVAVHDPYRLLVLDPTTLETLKSTELPGKVRHLQLAMPGGPVLVGSETANQLFEVPLVSDDSPLVVDVGEHPHDAAGAADGEIVVGNEFSGSMSFIKDGKVVGTQDDLQQPGGVLIDAQTVVAVDVGAFTVSTYDLATMQRTGITKAGEGPTHGALLSNHRVAAIDTRGDQVLVYDLDTLKQVGRISLPGSPYGVASDPTSDTLWVTLTGSNEVVGLDVSGDEPKEVARYATPQQPDTVAVAPGAKTLWVTGTAKGEIQRITR